MLVKLRELNALADDFFSPVIYIVFLFGLVRIFFNFFIYFLIWRKDAKRVKEVFWVECPGRIEWAERRRETGYQWKNGPCPCRERTWLVAQSRREVSDLKVCEVKKRVKVKSWYTQEEEEERGGGDLNRWKFFPYLFSPSASGVCPSFSDYRRAMRVCLRVSVYHRSKPWFDLVP